jgi:hypothetical protein
VFDRSPERPGFLGGHADHLVAYTHSRQIAFVGEGSCPLFALQPIEQFKNLDELCELSDLLDIGKAVARLFTRVLGNYHEQPTIRAVS